MSDEALLAIVNARGQVLAQPDAIGNPARLPRVRVEPGRMGVSLARAVRNQLNLDVFCLATAKSSEYTWELMRLQDDNTPLPKGCLWTAPENVIECLEGLPSAVFNEAETFGGYEWYRDVHEWLKSVTADLGYHVHSLEQWNGYPGHVLLRVTTDGPQFWFKAATGQEGSEMAITQILAERHPRAFPRVLAAQPDWNALLLENIEGRELDECDELATWVATAEALADIQLNSEGMSNRLLDAGAFDLRAKTILQFIPQLLDSVDDAMRRQPKTPPDVLSRADLDELREGLSVLCEEVDSLPFADGLANADFSPHNTLVTKNGPVFIDWEEACVSLPLIAGEYMWNRMVVESPNRAPWQPHLREAYCNRWTDRYGARVVTDAFHLLPKFALLAAVTFHAKCRADCGIVDDRFLRSLARKLATADTMRQTRFHNARAV